ncbi:MAG: hypothetical protein JWQ18_1424, partial [Conexibacter sp.]|nr:hypothetical protein [Conexibacter sp.]
GDTLRVRRTDGSATETVELVGIDAPEDPEECDGAAATALSLARTFSAPADADGDGVLDTAGGTGALVTLTTDRRGDVRDGEGHLLAYVEIAGDDLGRDVVAAGFSEADDAAPRFERYGDYHEAELRASDAGLGAWSTCGSDFHAAV